MRGKDNMRSGGEVLVDQLIAMASRHVFCVPGESYLAALACVPRSRRCRTVCRQEGGAVMMAEAVGKLTGRPGIASSRASRRHQRLAGAAHRAAGLHAGHQFVGGRSHARCASARHSRNWTIARCSAPSPSGDRNRRSGAYP